MSSSFIAIALSAAVLIVFWRLTLLVAAALIVAMVASGISYVADAVKAAPPAYSVVIPGPTPPEAGHPH